MARDDKEIVVLRPGSTASLAGVECIVLESIVFGDGSVDHQVAWMDGNVRHCERVSSRELNVGHEAETVVVGFAK